MKHFTSPEFWDFFGALPNEVQRRARRSFELLKSSPRHPSLRFQQVGSYWSVRVGRGYRALGIDAEDGILWSWIGTHADYDKLLPWSSGTMARRFGWTWSSLSVAATHHEEGGISVGVHGARAWRPDRSASILPARRNTMALQTKTEPVPLREDDEGVIRVGGTRVTLDTVLTAYVKGSTPEQIAQDYSSLDVADVYAAIAYYLRHREEVEEYLQRRRQLAEAVRTELKERFPSEGLRERLESRLR